MAGETHTNYSEVLVIRDTTQQCKQAEANTLMHFADPQEAYEILDEFALAHNDSLDCKDIIGQPMLLGEGVYGVADCAEEVDEDGYPIFSALNEKTHITIGEGIYRGIRAFYDQYSDKYQTPHLFHLIRFNNDFESDNRDEERDLILLVPLDKAESIHLFGQVMQNPPYTDDFKETLEKLAWPIVTTYADQGLDAKKLAHVFQTVRLEAANHTTESQNTPWQDWILDRITDHALGLINRNVFMTCNQSVRCVPDTAKNKAGTEKLPTYIHNEEAHQVEGKLLGFTSLPKAGLSSTQSSCTNTPPELMAVVEDEDAVLVLVPMSTCDVCIIAEEDDDDDEIGYYSENE